MLNIEVGNQDEAVGNLVTSILFLNYNEDDKNFVLD
jgi:hypothetical protein